MENFKTYIIPDKLGYIGDLTREYWSQEDYDRWEDYVKKLKASGDFGKDVEYEVTMSINRADDDFSRIPKSNVESFRMGFLDFSKSK